MPLFVFEGVNPKKLGVLPCEAEEAIASFKKYLQEQVALNPILKVQPKDVAVTVIKEYAVGDNQDVIIKVYCDRKDERTKEVLDGVGKDAIKVFVSRFPAQERVSAFVFPIDKEVGRADFQKEKNEEVEMET